MASSVFKKGKSAVGAPGSGRFIKINPDESVLFAPMTGLDEMISCDQHEFWDITPAVIVPCLGKGCPACATGNEARFKAFLPVLTKEEGVKIYSFGIRMFRQLEELEAELGSLKGKVIKVKRSGSGMSTQYFPLSTGKTMDVSKAEQIDLIEHLGPSDADEIRKLLIDRGVTDVPRSETADTPKAAKKDDDWEEI